MISRIACALIPSLLLSACLFETEKEKSSAAPVEIRPDLSIGNQWMYLSRVYVKHGDGNSGDTTRAFICYRITGDSAIGGKTYRILSEEDLAAVNTDQGLRKYSSLYAIDTVSSAGADSGRIDVNMLRIGTGAAGRLPFKSSARSSFDTVHFEDEITALVSPVSAGETWIFRAPGQPFGHAAGRKTFLGRENIEVAGERVAALKFQVAIEGLDFIKTYEWYAEGKKIFSRSSYAVNESGTDSQHFEEEYAGNRYFSREDTAAVLSGSNIPAPKK
jgi:hypothetical protein